jgi:Xaa-Pro aminopeptidase
MSLVDAGTVELVRAQGVKIRSSSDIVQFAKSLWGPAGRMSHYVAVHHLDALRKDALAFIAAKVKAGAALTERDVQARISRGYRIRGLDGPPPMVAVNSNAADPHYTPSKNSSALIKKGDLVLLDLAARVDGGDKRTIFAEMTWMAYVGETVPPRYRTLFEAVAQARDAGIDLIENRSKRRRAIKGFEVDQKVRSVIGKAGFADAFVHRTGHSLDTRVHGDGANLDDYETHDTRNLVMGSGFTIEPGIYVKGDVGVRTGVAVYIGRQGVEVTTPVQTEITAILSAR